MKQLNPNLIQLSKRQYLQKTKLGEWRTIEPFAPYNEVTQKFDYSDIKNYNWFNFIIGTWSRLISVIIIVTLIYFITWAYKTDTEECRQIVYNQTYLKEKCLSAMIGEKEENNYEQYPSISLPTKDNAQTLS